MDDTVWKVVFLVLLTQAILAADPAIEDEQIRARVFLKILDEKSGIRANRVTLADWNYASNLTDENLQKQLKVQSEVAKETKVDWAELMKFNWKTFTNYDLHRQFQKYSILGTAVLPDEKYERLNKIISDMQATYSTAKICDFKDKNKCNLALEPDLTLLLANSRDADELKNIWIEWRKAVGPKVKNLYTEYVTLLNEASRLNNFTDASEYWLHSYESPDFKQQVEKLWEQLKPLYLQIHAYVRHQLRQKYGDVVSEKGPIPAHLLGNMWSQSWGNIYQFTLPKPDKKPTDVTQEMIRQNYTALKIFKLSEDFFTSINLTAMPELFWKNSILEKPNDREMVCHASAWDFYDGKDFRIKMCTQIIVKSLKTAHHEMGHIEYMIQYKDQPVAYRSGANPGFHEAVGDTIALSVQTAKHMHQIGLLESDADDEDAILNNLYKIGLDKIVFLPFGYLIDLWRWNVFSGKTTPGQYNCAWWQLRQDYQGIEPPVDRSEADFDPAAKYHVVADVPYIRYFVSYVIQFQFHRSLCEKAGQYDPKDPLKPLHNCDIYKSTAAGNALKNMLQLGASRPWPEAMEQLTGQKNMDAGGLLEYFRPLQKFLEAENKKNGVFIGWEPSKKAAVCKPKEN